MNRPSKTRGDRSGETRAGLLSASVMVALLSCSTRSGVEARPPVAIELGGLGLRALLPEGTDYRLDGSGDAVVLSLNPGSRAPSRLPLTPHPGPLPESYREQMELSPGTTIDYRVISSEGGSGGPESTLTGQLQIDGKTYAVEGYGQAEHDPPLAEVFALLRRLEADA